MIKILISIFYLWQCSHIEAQDVISKLDGKKKSSFYNKEITEIIDKEIVKYKKNNRDSVFMLIEDRENPIIDALVAVKGERSISVLYLYYLTGYKKYFVAELFPEQISPIQLLPLLKWLGNSSSSKFDSNEVNMHYSSYYFYFVFPKKRYEVKKWNSMDFSKDSELLQFEENKRELFDFFSFECKGNRPKIIRNYFLKPYRPPHKSKPIKVK